MVVNQSVLNNPSGAGVVIVRNNYINMMDADPIR